MVNDRFNIEDYDILISCYGSSKDDSNFGLVRVRGARLSVIDELSSVGIGIHSNKLYRLMRHRPYVTSSVLEMVVYEDAHLVAGSSSPLDPLHLVYHGISDPHDIFVHSSVIYIVSSGTNEIVCLDEKTFQVVKRIKFPGDGNAWHINCLNVINGKICISAFNICDDDFGWGKTPTKGTGFIMDIQTKEKIWDGLSMPHNPYEFGNKIAVCNSETKSVLFRDKDGDIEEVLFDGFTRGLQFSGRYMFVGISTNRTDNIGNAKVAVYDTVNKEIVREIVLPFPEIYSVCLIEKGKFSNIPLPINNLFLEKNLIIDAYKSRQYMSLLTEQKPLNTHKLKVGLTVEHISKKMKINTDYELTVKVENHNDMTMQSIMPFPINMAYHWKNIDGTYAIYDGDRTPLITPLFPFSYTDIGMRLKTPATPGNYVLEISMVQESLFWFEKYCDNLPESVEISVEE